MTFLSSKSSPIVIVGAGVFGLSTSIHLANRGYSNVTVLDKQNYEISRYSYDDGCDAASADINKIIRCSYGTQTEYQNLSIEALEHWKQWNEELRSGKTVPEGMTRNDKLYVNNGNLHMTDQSTLPLFERATLENMAAAGMGDTQLVTDDRNDIALAKESSFSFAIDPFKRGQRNKPNLGLLDTTGGTAFADKACCFALHKAKSLGVRFILGGSAGSFDSFTYKSASVDLEVTGIRTQDGKNHGAALTIIACGGWTPSIVPELDNLCEATAGSVVMMRDGPNGGVYGFPCDDRGVLKFGYRGTKFTNPKQQNDGVERSVPVTRWTTPETVNYIPRKAVDIIKAFISEYLPELGSNGLRIDKTRLCWYTDTFDNHFIVDHVPGRKGLMVASGGSGHAFMYLPNIGKWVTDVVEGQGLARELLNKWRWRALSDEDTPINVLMEGSEGKRALKNVMFCREDDLDLAPERLRSRL